MKKLFILIFLGLSLSGCAAIQAQKDNFAACMDNDGCHKKFDDAVAKGSTIGALIGAMGGPGAAAGGGVAGGSLGGFLTALYLGSKILKDKKKQEFEDAKNPG